MQSFLLNTKTTKVSLKVFVYKKCSENLILSVSHFFSIYKDLFLRYQRISVKGNTNFMMPKSRQETEIKAICIMKEN